MYRNSVLVALLFVFALATNMLGWADDEAKSDCDAKKIAGRYQIVSGEKFGVKVPEKDFDGSVVVFTTDAIVMTDKDQKQSYAATFKLEPGEKHCRITMTSTLAGNQGQTARGLVEKQGDTLRLIYALPGGDEPTEFRTKDKQLLFVLKPPKEAVPQKSSPRSRTGH